MSFLKRMDTLDGAINRVVERAMTPEELAPVEPNHSPHVPEERMRFLTLHLHDMQSVRWLPVYFLLIAVPSLVQTNHPRITAATSGVLIFAWFIALQKLTKSRFGVSNRTTAQRRSVFNFARWKSRKHWLRIYALFWSLEILIWDFGYLSLAWGAPHAEKSQIWSLLNAITIGMLTVYAICGMFAFFFWMAMDETNLVERRRVKAISAGAVFVASALGLMHWPAALVPPPYGFVRWPSMVLPVATGLILLANAVYDIALLLRCQVLARKEAHHA